MMADNNWLVEMGSYPIPIIGGGYAHSFIMITAPWGDRYLFEGHGYGRNGDEEAGGVEHFIPFYDDRIEANEYGIKPAHLRYRVPLFEGPGDIVWDQIVPALLEASEIINASDLNYEPITLDPFEEAQNSNSVVRTYTDVIEAVVERNGGEWRGIPEYYTDDDVLWHENNSVYLPGWDRNLLDQIGLDVPSMIEQLVPPSLPAPLDEIEVRPLAPLDGQPGAALDQAPVGGQRSDAATTSGSGDASGSAAARRNASTRTSATSLLGRSSAATSSATAKGTGSKTAKKAADGKLAKALSQPRDPWESLLTVPGASMSKRQKEQMLNNARFVDNRDPMFGPAMATYQSTNAASVERDNAPPPDTDGAPADADGKPLEGTMRTIGSVLDRVANAIGGDNAVRTFQGALNSLSRSQVAKNSTPSGMQARPLIPPLLVDGDLGPKTSQSASLAVHHEGAAAVADSFDREVAQRDNEGRFGAPASISGTSKSDRNKSDTSVSSDKKPSRGSRADETASDPVAPKPAVPSMRAELEAEDEPAVHQLSAYATPPTKRPGDLTTML